MPPQLALFVGICFSAWLFWRDMRERRAGSPALLIPGLWLAILGSRPLGYWFGMGATNKVEGSPFDRVVFLVLVLAAGLVLLRRGVDLAGVVSKNKALSLIYLYLLFSTLWSYYPMVSFKRWTKMLGCLLMALILLTETDPVESIRIVFVRCAYVLFPLSVVAAKYYPDTGRLLTRSWENMITGLTEHKNTLGQVVMVFGFMVVWDFIETRKRESGSALMRLNLNHIGTLLPGLWLFVKCNSQTTVVCVILGAVILWGGGRLLEMASPKRALAYCLVALGCLGGLEVAFGISDQIVQALGRDVSLTGRTEIWATVREQHVNPWIGSGFYGFWDRPDSSEMLDYIQSGFTTAHNGYLEMYLDGGLLGVALLCTVLATGIRRVTQRLLSGTFWGRVGFMYITIELIYNCSESDYFRLEPLWVTFLLVTIECSRRLPHAIAVSERFAKPSEPLVSAIEVAEPYKMGSRSEEAYGSRTA